MHQVILSFIVSKYLANKVFEYKDTWGKTLAYISLAIRASSHRTIKSTSVQSVFYKDMIFNLDSVIEWPVITAEKQRQVHIDTVGKMINKSWMNI